MSALTSTEYCQQKIASFIGTVLIIMAIVAGYSYGFSLNTLWARGNAAQTVINIQQSPILFRTGFIGWIVIFLLDVLSAWAMYHFFKPVSKNIATLNALLRLAYSCILAVAIGALAVALLLTGNGTSLSLQNHLVLLSIESFNNIWTVGLLLFGIHLGCFAYLQFKTIQIPALFAILTTIAAVCYTGISLAKIIIPQYSSEIASMDTVLSLPMALGELAIAIWLIVKSKTFTQRQV